MMQQRKPIQQQYFTRDREGVFRTSEGFDTVAKSPGLDNGFIKTALHPYCVYKAPQELLASGEQDESRYPESLVVFQADNGDMVIGRSIYVGTDFTGQRSASFTHQFIVPKERKEEFVREPERLFRISGFRSSYDIRGGKTIPELDGIPYERAEAGDPDRLLSGLGIDRVHFQQLVHALMSSVANKKKVYIALNTDISESAESAKRLLGVLYRCLPFAIRRQLGFMTFNSEPEGKQYLHVLFVEKGSIRLPDRGIEKEYLFDFPNGRFVNTQLPEQENGFFDFVWDKRAEPESLDRLFEFCEEALEGIGGNADLSPSSYYQLYSLFEVEQGNEALYDKHRSELIHTLVTFANAETIGRKDRLNELFKRLLRRDAMDGVTRPTPDYINSLLQYYPYAADGVKALIIQCFVLFINRMAGGRSGGDIRAAASIFDQLLTQGTIFDIVLQELYAKQPGTAESYVAYRMDQAGTVKALLEEIRFWVEHGDSMVRQGFFTNEVLKKAKRLLQTDSARRRIEAAGAMCRYFDELPGQPGKAAYEDFCSQLKLEIRLELLEGLNPAHLDYEDFMQLGFMLDSADRELNSHLDKSRMLTLQLMSVLYRLLTLTRQGDSGLIKAIDGLGPLDLERVQESLKKLLGPRMAPEHFNKIAYAFYQPGQGRDAGYTSEFDYYGLLEFIASATSGTDTIYDFLVWSAGDTRFLNVKNGIDANYKAAIGKYFDRREPRAFRNKAVAQKLLAAPNESFRALFKAVKLRQSGKLVRFFYKNKRKLSRIGMIAAAFLILLLIFRNPLSVWFSSFGPAPVLAVEPVPEVSTSPTLTLKASADGADPEVSLYLNGQFAGNGSISKTITLHDGDNTLDLKAVDRGGKESEVVHKKVAYSAPAPTVTVEPLPEVSKTNTVTIKVSAADATDPSPTIYINGEAAGASPAVKTVTLDAGENTIEIKAGNKQGKMSEPVAKKIKYEPAAGAKTTR